MALDLAQMVLEVPKNLKPTQFYMLNNLCYNNFAQKSIPGGVLALHLLLAVYGFGLGPDGPGCPKKMLNNPVLYAMNTLWQKTLAKKSSCEAAGGRCGTPKCRRT